MQCRLTWKFCKFLNLTFASSKQKGALDLNKVFEGSPFRITVYVAWDQPSVWRSPVQMTSVQMTCTLCKKITATQLYAIVEPTTASSFDSPAES